MGKDVISKIAFVCSDMWEPYLKLIRENCSEALHILDRFHIVANMNKALDNVRAEETSRMRAAPRSSGNPAGCCSVAVRTLAPTSTSGCAISFATISRPSAPTF